MNVETLIKAFEPLFAGTGGIDSWIHADTPPAVLHRLLIIEQEPLTLSQLNQLLTLAHEAGVGDGFFTYYWLDIPDHPYDVQAVGGYSETWKGATDLVSLAHLYWGLYRFYVDALLYFGNIRAAYRYLRALTLDELKMFYSKRRFDTDRMKRRGAPLNLHEIKTDDRYLISEMACKSIAPSQVAAVDDIGTVLGRAYVDVTAMGKSGPTVRELVSSDLVAAQYAERQGEFLFTISEIQDDIVDSSEALGTKFAQLGGRFRTAREAASKNTELYLSMVDDLDVYVATSMRYREDFRLMSAFCDEVFSDHRLTALNLRHFNPTMSSADSHEDKGLIECLMVKCAKVLIYYAADRESYGKDAEASMALSLGKPVIFFADDAQRGRFYRDVHPLSRLIEFSTGVAVGAMVASTPEEVVELLERIFTNAMHYELEKSTSCLQLRETLSKCTVRLQTGDPLLRETFWNYYHHERRYGQSVSPLGGSS
jgi:hypothetical protein